jgi:hypothetical protein
LRAATRVYVTAVIQRLVLEAILAGASPTNERITNAKVRKANEDSAPPNRFTAVGLRELSRVRVCSSGHLELGQATRYDRPHAWRVRLRLASAQLVPVPRASRS